MRRHGLQIVGDCSAILGCKLGNVFLDRNHSSAHRIEVRRKSRFEIARNVARRPAADAAWAGCDIGHDPLSFSSDGSRQPLILLEPACEPARRMALTAMAR